MEEEIKSVEELYQKEEMLEFKVGDTIKVHVKIEEAGRIRTQIFQGVVIRKKGSGINESFTVRKSSYGIGVERVFPIHSPTIEKIEVIRKGKVRRSKLYYLRRKVGKKTRIKEKR